MRYLACLFVALTLASQVLAAGGKKQADNRIPVKLPIRHADPWAVKAMIEGSSITQPELSTIINVIGGGQNMAGNSRQGSTSPLLQDGFLVVNPTDNSLWWYPNRK